MADDWVVSRYVIMPDHIHLFCAPTLEARELAIWMKHWKSYSSSRWPSKGDQPIWQQGHWDTRLRTAESYSQKWHYVFENPVRKGLVKDARTWPFAGEIEQLGMF